MAYDDRPNPLASEPYFLRPALCGVLAIALALIGWRLAGHYYLDDSFFGYSYAKNLAEGHGFVFNAGERYLGTSAPLVVPIYALLYKLFGVPIPLAGQVGSLLFLSLGALAFYGILSERGGSVSAFFAALAFATTPVLTSVISHETIFYIGFGLLSVWALTRRRYGLAGLLIALAALSRSEAVVLGGLTVALLAWRRQYKALTAYCLVGALAVAPWLAFATWYFGSPVSNTVQAKHIQFLYGSTPFWEGIGPYFRERLQGPKGLVALGVLAAGCSLSVARWFFPWGALLAAWVLLQNLIYLIVKVPFYHWFVAQFSVLLALLVYGAGRAIGEARGWRRLPPGVVLGAAVALVLGGNVKAVAASGGGLASRPYYKLAEWIKAHTAPNAKVAYCEIGLLKFYSDRFIVDTLGLVTPGVLPHLKSGDTAWAIRHYQPDVVITNAYFSTIVPLEQYPWFHKAYRLQATLTDLGYSAPLKVWKLVSPPAIAEGGPFLGARVRVIRPSAPITRGSPLEQELELDAPLGLLEMKFDTFGRGPWAPYGPIRSHYVLELRQGDHVAAVWRFDAAQVVDNVYKVFEVPPGSTSRGHYTLRLSSPDARTGQALAVWLGASPEDGATPRVCLRLWGAPMAQSAESR